MCCPWCWNLTHCCLWRPPPTGSHCAAISFLPGCYLTLMSAVHRCDMHTRAYHKTGEWGVGTRTPFISCCLRTTSRLFKPCFKMADHDCSRRFALQIFRRRSEISGRSKLKGGVFIWRLFLRGPERRPSRWRTWWVFWAQNVGLQHRSCETCFQMTKKHSWECKFQYLVHSRYFQFTLRRRRSYYIFPMSVLISTVAVNPQYGRINATFWTYVPSPNANYTGMFLWGR